MGLIAKGIDNLAASIESGARAVRAAIGGGSRASSATAPALSVRSWSEPPETSQETILRLYQTSIEFRTVVGTIAGRFAAANMYPERDGEVLPEDHPIAKVWRRPNDQLTGSAVREVEGVWLDTLDRSAARLLVVDGRPHYYPVCPLWVERSYDEDAGLRFKVQWPSGETSEHGADEFVLMGHPDALNPYGLGSGKGVAASDEVETSEYAAKFVKANFYNGATPNAIVGMYSHGPDGAIIGPSSEDASRMKQAWLAKHQGVANAGGIEFVRGKLDVVQLQPALRDLVVPELRKMSADLVRQLYGVPPELVGQLENSNRATIEEALAIFAIMVLIPRLEFYSTQWNEQVLPKLGALGVDVAGIRITYTSPVPEDRARRAELMKEHPYAFTLNEIRADAGLPARADGEVYMREPGVTFVPAGMTEDQAQEAHQRAAREAERLRSWEPEPEPEEADPVVVRIWDDARYKADYPSLEMVLAELEPERIEQAYRTHTQRSLEQWATLAAAETGFEMDFTILNPFVAGWTEEHAAEFITRTSATTKSQVRAQLVEGIRKGEGPRALAKRVQDAGTFSRSRAELIARTETNRAANAGKLQAYKMNPAVDSLRWSTSFANSRPWHISMNGQVRPVGEPFVSGRGATAESPGGFGAPSEDCRCKCTVLAVIPGQVRDASELVSIQRAWEDETDAAAKAMADDVYRALRHQLNRQILPAIERVFGTEEAAS